MERAKYGEAVATNRCGERAFWAEAGPHADAPGEWALGLQVLTEARGDGLMVKLEVREEPAFLLCSQLWVITEWKVFSLMSAFCEGVSESPIPDLLIR